MDHNKEMSYRRLTSSSAEMAVVELMQQIWAHTRREKSVLSNFYHLRAVVLGQIAQLIECQNVSLRLSGFNPASVVHFSHLLTFSGPVGIQCHV